MDLIPISGVVILEYVLKHYHFLTFKSCRIRPNLLPLLPTRHSKCLPIYLELLKNFFTSSSLICNVLSFTNRDSMTWWLRGWPWNYGRLDFWCGCEPTCTMLANTLQMAEHRERRGLGHCPVLHSRDAEKENNIKFYIVQATIIFGLYSKILNYILTSDQQQ